MATRNAASWHWLKVGADQREDLTPSLCSFRSIPGVFPESPRWLLLTERSSDTSSFGERRNSGRDLRDDESFTGLFSLSPPPSSQPITYGDILFTLNGLSVICETHEPPSGFLWKGSLVTLTTSTNKEKFSTYFYGHHEGILVRCKQKQKIIVTSEKCSSAHRELFIEIFIDHQRARLHWLTSVWYSLWAFTRRYTLASVTC